MLRVRAYDQFLYIREKFSVSYDKIDYNIRNSFLTMAKEKKTCRRVFISTCDLIGWQRENGGRCQKSGTDTTKAAPPEGS